MLHFTVVSCLEVCTNPAYCFVSTIAVVNDYIAFGAIEKRFDVVTTLSCNRDDWVDVAIACEFDSK